MFYFFVKWAEQNQRFYVCLTHPLLRQSVTSEHGFDSAKQVGWTYTDYSANDWNYTDFNEGKKLSNVVLVLRGQQHTIHLRGEKKKRRTT